MTTSLSLILERHAHTIQGWALLAAERAASHRNVVGMISDPSVTAASKDEIAVRVAEERVLRELVDILMKRAVEEGDK